ncbi:MAG TPA: hypothetical protein VJ799_11085 [Nitrososphaeraceae archaeon]|jgi:hypothetical protein|nr:hypothetical protein [Nitrososphaeraceae archaeon]
MKSHIIQNGVAEETEVDGMLRNSLLAGDWGMYEELASEYVSPVNLIATTLSPFKNFIVVKDLEQCRSSRLQSTIKLPLARNI